MIGYYLSSINEICYSMKTQIFLPTKHTLRLTSPDEASRHTNAKCISAPYCVCHAALQQAMQRGRQTVFGGERKCKNTLHLSSDAKCTFFSLQNAYSRWNQSKILLVFFQTNSFQGISNSICVTSQSFKMPSKKY